MCHLKAGVRAVVPAALSDGTYHMSHRVWKNHMNRYHHIILPRVMHDLVASQMSLNRVTSLTSTSCLVWSTSAANLADIFSRLCRQKRLLEMQEASTKPTSGSLEFIRSSEFKEKVTEQSSKCWVVVLLFKEECVTPFEQET
jgi:hypothetical protein